MEIKYITPKLKALFERNRKAINPFETFKDT